LLVHLTVILAVVVPTHNVLFVPIVVLHGNENVLRRTWGERGENECGHKRKKEKGRG
jgi:hypothetical protein